MTRGVVASLVATDAGGSAVVVFADTITQAGECKIELHAYHPKSRRAQLLTQLTLPCQLGREVRVLASRVVRATYITVITESALRVFALRKGPQGYDAVPTWTYASTPRAEGGLAGPIAVAASNRAVYVLAEWWSDFFRTERFGSCATSLSVTRRSRSHFQFHPRLEEYWDQPTSLSLRTIPLSC